MPVSGIDVTRSRNRDHAARLARGRRLGVIVRHDDAAREYAYDRASRVGRLDRALADAPAKGWIVASMRDWTRVFS